MDESIPAAELVEQPVPGEFRNEPPGQSEWSGLIELACWAVIVAISVLVFIGHWLEQNVASDESPKRNAIAYRDVRAVASQTRLAVGFRQMLGEGIAGAAAETADPGDLNTGSLFRRYAGAIQLAEQESAGRALGFLGEVDAKVAEILAQEALVEPGMRPPFKPDERHVAVRSALQRVFEARQALELGTVSELAVNADDRDLLKEQFGWLGELAVEPRAAADASYRPGIEKPAVASAIGVVVLGGVGLLVAFGALVATVVAITLWRRGWFKPALPHQAHSGTVYLEAFVVGVLLMMVMGPVAMLSGLPAWLAVPAAQLSVLAALGWPLARGVSWSRMASDVGLTAAKPLREIGSGLFGYFCTVFALGCCLVLLAPVFFAQLHGSDDDLRSPPALHPIEDMLAEGSAGAYVFVFVLACVLAPLVEEVLFRGLFFRYLRDRTGGFGRRRSVLLSLAASGIVFAGIHPQNLVGLLPLFTLAAGMSLLREWRGSLIAPMTLHAVNNFLATSAMMLTQ